MEMLLFFKVAAKGLPWCRRMSNAGFSSCPASSVTCKARGIRLPWLSAHSLPPKGHGVSCTIWQTVALCDQKCPVRALLEAGSYVQVFECFWLALMNWILIFAVIGKKPWQGFLNECHEKITEESWQLDLAELGLTWPTWTFLALNLWLFLHFVHPVPSQHLVRAVVSYIMRLKMLRPIRSVWKKSSPVLMEPQQIRKSCERPRVLKVFSAASDEGEGRKPEANWREPHTCSLSGIDVWIESINMDNIVFKPSVFRTMRLDTATWALDMLGKSWEQEPKIDWAIISAWGATGPNHNSQTRPIHSSRKWEKNRTAQLECGQPS